MPGDVPDGFELLLSTDGATFTPVLAGHLSTLMAEQAFVLDEPVEATHAQLRILGAHGGGFGQVVLGEWKVVADPGVVPEPPWTSARRAASTSGVRRPEAMSRGSTPRSRTCTSPSGWSMTIHRSEYVSVEPGAPLTWAIGFRAGRAAQVERPRVGGRARIEPRPADRRGRRRDQPRRAGGAVGGVRSMDPGACAGRQRDAVRSSPTAPGPAPSGCARCRSPARRDTGQRELPAAIRVIERATDGDYRSVLGEWGAASPAGPYERLTVPDVAMPPADAGRPTTRPRPPARFAPGQPASGRVSADVDVDWYAITVPEGDNSLMLEVAGRPIAGRRPDTLRRERPARPDAVRAR